MSGFTGSWKENNFIKETVMIEVSKSIYLRPLALDDLIQIKKLINNDDFLKKSTDSYPFPNTSFPVKASYIESYLKQSIKQFKSKQSTIDYWIIYQWTLVWVFSYTQWTTYRSLGNITIWYWIGNLYRWKWIVTEVVRSMTYWIFKNIKYAHRIRANVSENNIWSSKVLEKCWFILESLHKDSIMYEWRYLSEKVYVILKE